MINPAIYRRDTFLITNENIVFHAKFIKISFNYNFKKNTFYKLQLKEKENHTSNTDCIPSY